MKTTNSANGLSCLFFAAAMLLLTILPVMAQTMPPSFITNGLIAYYPFTASSIADITGHSSSQTNYGAIPTADRFGILNNAYYFNETNQSAIIYNISFLPLGNNPRSISMWFQSTKYTPPFATGFKASQPIGYGTFNGIGGDCFLQYVYEGVPNVIALTFQSDDLDVVANWQSSWNWAKWHHLVWTYSGSNVYSVYLDGKSIGLANPPSPTAYLATASGLLYIGYYMQCYD